MTDVIHQTPPPATVSKIIFAETAEAEGAAAEATGVETTEAETGEAEATGAEAGTAEKEELKKYVISCGYKPGATLFGGVNEGKLRCLRNRTEAKVVRTLSKSVGLPKLEADLCRYQRYHITGSLLYANFKVTNFIIIVLFMF